VTEKLRAQEQLELTLQENQRRIQEQQEKLAEMTRLTETERNRELERMRIEREEAARREVCRLFVFNILFSLAVFESCGNCSRFVTFHYPIPFTLCCSFLSHP
jgi:hypothetical protein